MFREECREELKDECTQECTETCEAEDRNGATLTSLKEQTDFIKENKAKNQLWKISYRVTHKDDLRNLYCLLP